MSTEPSFTPAEPGPDDPALVQDTPVMVPATPDSSARDYTWKLVYWLCAAMLLRLFIIRFPYMFTLDVNTFRSWGDTIAKVGPTQFYNNTWSDYPPLFMYFLWAWALIQSPFTHSTVMTVQWAKMPACIADIVNACLIFWLLKGRVAIRSAYRTAVLYAFNPVILFVSAVWGQVDAIITMMMLLIMVAIMGNRLILSAVVSALAVMVKPQGLFFIPVVFSTMWWRNPLWKWPLAVIAGLVTSWVVLLPATWTKLGGWVTAGAIKLPAWLIQPFFWFQGQMKSTGDNYPYSTVNAFNIWMLPPPNETWKPDSRILFGLTHYTWGMILIGLCLVLIGVYVWRNRHVAGAFPYFLAAATTLTAFYMLPTRMHERYIFPAIAFLALAQACNRRLSWLYWSISLSMFLSIAYIFFFYNDQSAWVEGVKQIMGNGYMLGSLKLSGMVILSLVNVWLFGELLSFLFVQGDMVTDIGENKLVHHFRTLSVQVRQQLVARADWLIPTAIALVWFAFALFRLGTPSEQIFDEVYHARTAMEYIAGIPPYEWTHPPLAKLLAACGILLWHGQFPLETKTFTEHMAFSWRFMSVVFGSLTLVATFALARSLFENRAIATAATLILAVDGVFFTQSRVAMTNIYEVFFIILGTLGTWLYLKHNQEKWMFLMAFGLGCALATRWSSLYAWGLTGLVLLYHAYRVKRLEWVAEPASDWTGLGRDLRAANKLQMLRWVGMLALTMGVIPVLLYLATYFPYVLQGDGSWQLKVFNWDWHGKGWGKVISWQKDMWIYHAGLQATHPYSSPWWSWPIMLRPTWYYFHDFKEAVGGAPGIGGLASYVAAGPVLLIGSLVAVPAAIVMAYRSQLRPAFITASLMGFMLLGWLVQSRVGLNGPWAMVSIPLWWLALPLLGAAYYLAWRDRQPALALAAVVMTVLWSMWGLQPTSGPATIGGVWAIGNAFVWWAAIPALLYAGYLAWRDGLKSLGLITVLGLGLWAMWGVQPRPLLYMHYMFESIPFAAIALAYIGYMLWNGRTVENAPDAAPDDAAVATPFLTRKQQRAVVIVYGSLIAGWFVFYYPLLSGLPIPWAFYNAHVWFSRAWI